MLKANEIYNQLEKMFPVVKCELNYQNIYQLTIAVVLSAQTTDVAVNKVTPQLFSNYPSFNHLANANVNDVHRIIKTLGLANSKAKNIVELSKKLVLEKNGEISPNFDYLLTLPGIGRKTANVILSEGFKIPRIPVDTHVLRISNRLNLINSENPVVVEKKLMEIFEETKWYDAHLRLLFFGRYFCKAKNPNCETCPFTNLCQYFTKKTP